MGVERAVERGFTTLILPLGATEQHGPHLPLATDTIRADALAERVSRLLPGSLIAPTLPFGCSDEHSGFAGLLGLDHETLARVIVDIARRACGWGITTVMVVSAHGGNAEALRLAGEILDREIPELFFHTNDNLESVSQGIVDVAAESGISPKAAGLHAGEGETSEMLFLRPDLVGANREPGFTGDMESVMDDLRRGGLRSVTQNGILGDPQGAEAGRGARYLDAVAQVMAKKVSGEP